MAFVKRFLVRLIWSAAIHESPQFKFTQFHYLSFSGNQEIICKQIPLKTLSQHLFSRYAPKAEAKLRLGLRHERFRKGFLGKTFSKVSPSRR